MRYSSEQGEVKIPTSQWSGLKLLLLESWNNHRERVFRLATAVHAKTGAPLHATWEQIRTAWAQARRADEGELDAIERVLFPNLSEAKTGRPRKPTRKQLDVVLPKATRRTFAYQLHRNALILLRDTERTVLWRAEGGPHAVELAHEHRVARDLFKALEKVGWNRSSGGRLYGSDERSLEVGASPGGNYVVASYGRSEPPKRVMA